MNKWDLPAQLAIKKDVLVIGAPGTGYESLFFSALGNKRTKFRHRLLGDCGFRSSSLHPHQWFVDVNKLFYEMTSSFSRPTIWYGYADNIESILFMPWLEVYFLSIDDDVYTDRVNMYRSQPPISMPPSDDVNRTLLAIKHRLEYIFSQGSRFFGNDYFEDVPFKDKVEDITKLIESRISTKRWKFLYDDQHIIEQISVVEDDVKSVKLDVEGSVEDIDVDVSDDESDESINFLNH